MKIHLLLDDIYEREISNLPQEFEMMRPPFAKKEDPNPESNGPQRRSLRASIADPLQRKFHDDEVVGLAEGAKRMTEPLGGGSLGSSLKVRYEQYHGDIPLEDDEKYARMNEERRPPVLFLLNYYTACKIFLYYLVSMSSLLTLTLSVGLTIYWYEIFQSDTQNQLNASGMDWVLLGFAVVTPLSLAVGIAFRRRERALIEIARFRSFAFQLFIAHCIWDWDVPPDIKGRAGTNVDWVGHADDVLTELIAIGDELCRFLTLPTISRSRHRVTRKGRREAARTAEVAYRLYDSLYTKRLMRLSILTENFKRAGLPSGEASRIRQYERFIGETIETLRMIKSYRTPQTLRSFARIFTTLLPPFFAPAYAQIAKNMNSLAMGITFSVITALCLNALLEGVEILEDPFVAFVTLDGIDVREEFQVLHWHQLVTARNDIFPADAPYSGPRKNSYFVASVAQNDTHRQPITEMLEEEQIAPVRSVSDSTNGSCNRHMTLGKSHRRIMSLGDGNLLARLEEGIDPSARNMEYYRKSAYQLFSTPNAKPDSDGSRDLDTSFAAKDRKVVFSLQRDATRKK